MSRKPKIESGETDMSLSTHNCDSLLNAKDIELKNLRAVLEDTHSLTRAEKESHERILKEKREEISCLKVTQEEMQNVMRLEKEIVDKLVKDKNMEMSSMRMSHDQNLTRLRAEKETAEKILKDKVDEINIFKETKEQSIGLLRQEKITLEKLLQDSFDEVCMLKKHNDELQEAFKSAKETHERNIRDKSEEVDRIRYNLSRLREESAAEKAHSDKLLKEQNERIQRLDDLLEESKIGEDAVCNAMRTQTDILKKLKSYLVEAGFHVEDDGSVSIPSVSSSIDKQPFTSVSTEIPIVTRPTPPSVIKHLVHQESQTINPNDMLAMAIASMETATRERNRLQVELTQALDDLSTQRSLFQNRFEDMERSKEMEKTKTDREVATKNSRLQELEDNARIAELRFARELSAKSSRLESQENDLCVQRDHKETDRAIFQSEISDRAGRILTLEECVRDLESRLATTTAAASSRVVELETAETTAAATARTMVAEKEAKLVQLENRLKTTEEAHGITLRALQERERAEATEREGLLKSLKAKAEEVDFLRSSYDNIVKTEADGKQKLKAKMLAALDTVQVEYRTMREGLEGQVRELEDRLQAAEAREQSLATAMEDAESRSLRSLAEKEAGLVEKEEELAEMRQYVRELEVSIEEWKEKEKTRIRAKAKAQARAPSPLSFVCTPSFISSHSSPRLKDVEGEDDDDDESEGEEEEEDVNCDHSGSSKSTIESQRMSRLSKQRDRNVRKGRAGKMKSMRELEEAVRSLEDQLHEARSEGAAAGAAMVAYQDEVSALKDQLQVERRLQVELEGKLADMSQLVVPDQGSPRLRGSGGGSGSSSTSSTLIRQLEGTVQELRAKLEAHEEAADSALAERAREVSALTVALRNAEAQRDSVVALHKEVHAELNGERTRSVTDRRVVEDLQDTVRMLHIQLKAEVEASARAVAEKEQKMVELVAQLETVHVRGEEGLQGRRLHTTRRERNGDSLMAKVGEEGVDDLRGWVRGLQLELDGCRALLAERNMQIEKMADEAQRNLFAEQTEHAKAMQMKANELDHLKAAYDNMMVAETDTRQKLKTKMLSALDAVQVEYQAMKESLETKITQMEAEHAHKVAGLMDTINQMAAGTTDSSIANDETIRHLQLRLKQCNDDVIAITGTMQTLDVKLSEKEVELQMQKTVQDKVVRSLQGQLQGKMDEIDNLLVRNNELQVDADLTNVRLRAVEEAMEEAQATNRILQQGKLQWEADLAEANRVIDSLNATVVSKECALDSMHDLLEKTNASVQVQLQSKTDEIELLQTRLTELSDAEKSHRKGFALVGKEKFDLEDRLLREKEAVEKLFRKKSEEVEVLTIKLERIPFLETELSRSKRSLADASAELEKMKFDFIPSGEQKKANSRELVLDLRMRLRVAEESAEAAAKRVLELEGEIVGCRRSLDEKDNRLEKTVSDMQKVMSIESKSNERAMAAKTKELENLTGIFQEAQRTIEDLILAEKSLRTQLDTTSVALITTQNKYRQEKESLMREVLQANTTGQLGEVRNMIVAISVRLFEIEQEFHINKDVPDRDDSKVLERLEAVWKAIKEKLKSRKSQSKELLETVSGLRQQLEGKSEELRAAQASLVELKEASERRMSVHAETKAQLDDVTSKYDILTMRWKREISNSEQRLAVYDKYEADIAALLPLKEIVQARTTEAEKLAAIIVEKDSVINTLNSVIVQKEGECVALQQATTRRDKDEGSGAHLQKLKLKDDTIRSLNEALQQKEVLIVSLHTAVEEHKNLAAELEAVKQALSFREEDCKTKASTIQTLEFLLSDSMEREKTKAALLADCRQERSEERTAVIARLSSVLERIGVGADELPNADIEFMDSVENLLRTYVIHSCFKG